MDIETAVCMYRQAKISLQELLQYIIDDMHDEHMWSALQHVADYMDAYTEYDTFTLTTVKAAE